VRPAQYTLIEGIKCYAPEVALREDHYPSEGFAVTDRLENESFWCRSRARILTHLVRRHTGPGAAHAVLEIGCGTGTILRELAGDGRFRLTGSEIYLSALRYAVRRSPGIEYIQLDATRMHFEAEFDVVGAFDVLEHVEDDAGVIRNVWRALRPGGHFIVMVPQYRFLWSSLDVIVGHKRRYGRRELLDRLRSGGFEIVRHTSFVFALFPLMVLRRLLDRTPPPGADTRREFEQRVAFPRVVNWLFDRVMRLDEALLRAGVSLPIGGSLIVVARRPFEVASPPP
jgi:SAM-dependent methyltransferase